MPLRVAEKDGYLYAVDGCGDCPFNGWDGHTITFCKHKDADMDSGLLYRDRIPAWCPLPAPAIQKKEIKELIEILREGRKRQDEIISSFLDKMWGKHPENISIMGFSDCDNVVKLYIQDQKNRLRKGSIVEVVRTGWRFTIIDTPNDWIPIGSGKTENYDIEFGDKLKILGPGDFNA